MDAYVYFNYGPLRYGLLVFGGGCVMGSNLVDRDVAWKSWFAPFFPSLCLNLLANVNDRHSFSDSSLDFFPNFSSDFAGALIFL